MVLNCHVSRSTGKDIPRGNQGDSEERDVSEVKGVVGDGEWVVAREGNRAREEGE